MMFLSFLVFFEYFGGKNYVFYFVALSKLWRKSSD